MEVTVPEMVRMVGNVAPLVKVPTWLKGPVRVVTPVQSPSDGNAESGLLNVAEVMVQEVACVMMLRAGVEIVVVVLRKSGSVKENSYGWCEKSNDVTS